MGRRSVRIEFRNEELVGWISVKDGTLWTAEDRLGTGLPAFHRLAFRRDGDVACSTLRENPGPRTLHDSWESLLIDAARILDETNRDGAPPDEHPLQLAPPLAPSPPPSVPPPSPQEQRFVQVWDQGLQALLGRRYEEALEAFLEAQKLCPEDRKVQANLARLEAMGYRPSSRIASPPGDLP
jgi:hypothetical protein